MVRLSVFVIGQQLEEAEDTADEDDQRDSSENQIRIHKRLLGEFGAESHRGGGTNGATPGTAAEASATASAN